MNVVVVAQVTLSSFNTWPREGSLDESGDPHKLNKYIYKWASKAWKKFIIIIFNQAQNIIRGLPPKEGMVNLSMLKTTI